MLKFWFSSLLMIGLIWVSPKMAAQNVSEISETQFLEEWDILIQSLREVHPALYQFTSKPAFDSLAQGYKRGITNAMTTAKFHLHVRRFLRHVGCGHLLALPSKQWYANFRKDVKLLPFDVYLDNGEIYVSQVFIPDSTLQPGFEITAINDRLARQILEEMRQFQTRDGFNRSFEETRLTRLFPTYHLFLYGKQDTFKVAFKNDTGALATVRLPAATQRKKRISVPLDTSTYRVLGQWPDVILAQHRQIDSLAILQLDAFNSRKYKRWQREVFEWVAAHEIQHLVLDLRGNGGGYFPNGNRLLRYVMPEEFSMDFHRPKATPKKNEYLALDFWSRLTKVAFTLMPDRDKADTNRNYRLRYSPKKRHAYRGKIWVLTDGGTFSLASMVASKLKYHTKAKVIGLESGGGATGSNGVLFYWLTLPYSQIRVRIPYYHLDHQVPAPRMGHGVMRHFTVSTSLPQHLNREDPVLAKVEALVRQGANTH